MLAKKTSKNQITIPKKIAESFPDVEYFDIRVEGDKILLAPAKILPAGPPLERVRGRLDAKENPAWTDRPRAAPPTPRCANGSESGWSGCRAR